MKGILQKAARMALFAVVSVSAPTALSVQAEEYQSMIRYDRVWEHISIRWSDHKVYYAKFDGPQEINGKTYHRLATFRKASYQYNFDGQPEIFDIDENYYEHEGYLREENGKVYTLMSKGTYNPDYYPGELYKQTPSGPEVEGLEERLLYDFTCPEGGSYQAFHTAPGWATDLTYNVKSVERVEIDGEEHRLQRIYTNDYPDIIEPIIEGIGIGNYGCLTSIWFLAIPTCPCMDHIFNRVLSTDGRVLYRTEYDCVNLPVGGLNGVGSITSVAAEDASPIYDMLGRRIITPSPGQLYIQGGHKRIGK